MVDVTFLLLIFFMVTASFSMQKSIAMPRQQSDLPSPVFLEQPEETLEIVQIEIGSHGGFFVLTSDWELEIAGKQNLVSRLRQSVESGNGETQLKILVHEQARLQALVDAIDAGTIAGFVSIDLRQVGDLP